MLILSRKMDEAIVIDENIVVTVLEVRGGNVRLGLVAPDDVRILRAELVEETDTESESDELKEAA